LQKFVEDPLSEALIQGEIGEASVIEVFLDESGLNYRPAGIEEPGDALLIH
jgi:ATP-dependent Clp protease ATP-binding subunit ClpC